MHIWIVTIGEPIPIGKGKRDRLHRAGYLSHFLAHHGHHVIWWTSTFDHFRKIHLYEQDTQIKQNNHLQIKLIHGCGYKKNISMARIRDHKKIAKKF